MVTHSTTNLPVSCLSTAEQTGSTIFRILWSYVKETRSLDVHNQDRNQGKHSFDPEAQP
jgi:hypothetical protein